MTDLSNGQRVAFLINAAREAVKTLELMNKALGFKEKDCWVLNELRHCVNSWDGIDVISSFQGQLVANVEPKVKLVSDYRPVNPYGELVSQLSATGLNIVRKMMKDLLNEYMNPRDGQLLQLKRNHEIIEIGTLKPGDTLEMRWVAAVKPEPEHKLMSARERSDRDEAQDVRSVSDASYGKALKIHVIEECIYRMEGRKRWLINTTPPSDTDIPIKVNELDWVLEELERFRQEVINK